MKLIVLTLIALGVMVALTPEAQAIRCHAGVYRTGCIGPRGGYVRGHYPRYGASRCYWRAGRRVCY